MNILVGIHKENIVRHYLGKDDKLYLYVKDTASHY